MLEENIKGIQHLGIPVTDLERSKTFYARFGFAVVMTKTFVAVDGKTQVAMLNLGNLTLELYQLPDEACKEVAARHDGHIDHIALDVEDIDIAYTEIKSAGMEILENDAPVFLPFWTNGVKYFTVRGPDGEKVEFNQIL